MPTNGLFAIVTDDFVKAIRLAAARAGSVEALAREMGVSGRVIRRVICQKLVSEEWIDRYCASGLTELQYVDFEFKPWAEIMDDLDPEWRERRSQAAKRSHQTREELKTEIEKLRKELERLRKE